MDGTTTAQAEAEVATLVSELIAIDSSNFGNDEGPGEAEAADYVQQRCSKSGSRVNGSRQRAADGGRGAAHPGKDPNRKALLLHGHLDVVPAPEPDWVHPPFAGTIDEDGVVWGRGAVDMKDMDGMMLAVIRQWAINEQPDRDIVAMWLPDEEAGGSHGSSWLVDNSRDLFSGVSDAVGEVGASASRCEMTFGCIRFRLQRRASRGCGS